MPERTLDERVEILERKVEALEDLPQRVTAVEVQILQLREEMHGALSSRREDLRAEIRGGDEETRRYMRVLHEDVVTRITLLKEHE